MRKQFRRRRKFVQIDPLDRPFIHIDADLKWAMLQIFFFLLGMVLVGEILQLSEVLEGIREFFTLYFK